MLTKLKAIMLFMLLLMLQDASCGELGKVSWYFRGSALQNNTAIALNKADTLNLACRFVQATQGQLTAFYITKGSSPPTKAVGVAGTADFQKVTLTNPGVLVYSDFDGLQSGYESITIVPGSAGAYGTTSFRYLSIPVLTPTDAGTYHCTVYEYTATTPVVATVDATVILTPESRVARDVRSGRNKRAMTFADASLTGALSTSGGVTITVNTKPGQAASTQLASTKFLTYSAVLACASKLLL